MKFRNRIGLAPVMAPVMAVLLVGACFVLPASPVLAGKHPEPSVYPIRKCWYLDFKHSLPKRIVIEAAGLRAPTAFWYITYTVTNNSGKEVEFLPEYEMVTEDGAIHYGNRGIPQSVFDAIKKVTANDLMLPAAQISGPLHQGEDQAKDGVIIWEEPMLRMGNFSIYIGGLNDEFVSATDNDGKPILAPDGKPIVLRKTLELNYSMFGDQLRPGLNEVHAKPERWVMR